MHFESDEEDEYDAACALLVDRTSRWATQQCLAFDPFTAEALLGYRHRGTPDGRLGWWEPRHIDTVLLHWLPRTITVLPGENPADAPATLRTLLRYLEAVRLADPRGAAMADNLAAIDAAAPQYAAAMADRTRWGPAKFWATTAAGQGVDILDPEAMHRFVERAQHGKVPYDRAVLGRIMERQLTGGPALAARAEPQLPVVLPGDDVLRAQAATCTLTAQLRGLAQ